MKTVGEMIEYAGSLGVLYWQECRRGHIVTNEEYYSIKLDVYKNYTPIIKEKLK